MKNYLLFLVAAIVALIWLWALTGCSSGRDPDVNVYVIREDCEGKITVEIMATKYKDLIKANDSMGNSWVMVPVNVPTPTPTPAPLTDGPVIFRNNKIINP